METLSQSVKLREDGASLEKLGAELAAWKPSAVWCFACMRQFDEVHRGALEQLARRCGAPFIACSTAGEISQEFLHDDTVSVLAVRFTSSSFARTHSAILDSSDRSEQTGRALADALDKQGLRAVVVFGPGVDVNGSALIDGLRSGLPEHVVLAGGLAGDAGKFSGSFQMEGDRIDGRLAVVMGLYGDQLEVVCANRGGWRTFGPMRKATRVKDNVLLELDHAPALDIYKKYLGDYAKDLPGTGLLFPFEVRSSKGKQSSVMRTILGIDEAQGGLILAGDIHEGDELTLMHATVDSLRTGSESAAEALPVDPSKNKAVIAVSCVGRKLVMGMRSDEELEVLLEVLGESNTALAGFYSNGEISGESLLSCRLHNQTMTLTCITEK